LRTDDQVKKTFKKFDDVIGLENLKILHFNDSKAELNCNLDRHEHIGLGKIGTKGMGAVIKLISKKKIPIILETPIDDRRNDFENIAKAKSLA
jgi:deoxyribonuclease-4